MLVKKIILSTAYACILSCFIANSSVSAQSSSCKTRLKAAEKAVKSAERLVSKEERKVASKEKILTRRNENVTKVTNKKFSDTRFIRVTAELDGARKSLPWASLACLGKALVEGNVNYCEQSLQDYTRPKIKQDVTQSNVDTGVVEIIGVIEVEDPKSPSKDQVIRECQNSGNANINCARGNFTDCAKVCANLALYIQNRISILEGLKKSQSSAHDSKIKRAEDDVKIAEKVVDKAKEDVEKAKTNLKTAETNLANQVAVC